MLSQSGKNLDDLNKSSSKKKCNTQRRKNSSSSKENIPQVKRITKTENDLTQRKKVSETFKLSDILQNKEFYNALDEHLATKSSEQCVSTNSRFSNCQCNNKGIIEDNLKLKQDIMDYLGRIQEIVNKQNNDQNPQQQNEKQPQLNERFISQRNSTETIKRRASIDEFRTFNGQEFYNLNYIIQQQQIEITNLKTKLLLQDQKEKEKQNHYEYESLQMKNKIIMMNAELQRLQEQVNQMKFKYKMKQ